MRKYAGSSAGNQPVDTVAANENGRIPAMFRFFVVFLQPLNQKT